LASTSYESVLLTMDSCIKYDSSFPFTRSITLFTAGYITPLSSVNRSYPRCSSGLSSIKRVLGLNVSISYFPNPMLYSQLCSLPNIIIICFVFLFFIIMTRFSKSKSIMMFSGGLISKAANACLETSLFCTF
jgi:hypothetical protein